MYNPLLFTQDQIKKKDIDKQLNDGSLRIESLSFAHLLPNWMKNHLNKTKQITKV